MKTLAAEWTKSAKQSLNDWDAHNVFHSIDFLFAHKIFPNAPKQTSLFLAYLLKTAREGHLCVAIEKESLTPSLSAELDPQVIEGASLLSDLVLGKAVIQNKNRYYLQRNWLCEQRFIKHLDILTSKNPEIPISQEWLSQKLEEEPLQLEQKEAILHAAKSTLTLICGGPGTGKTYTAATLIRIFLEKINTGIVVAAPTGKATANIRSALGPLSEKCTVKTLHSLLKKERLYADLVLVDEGSMVDAEIMAKLFSAMKEGSRLILLGDKDQLPPVESGNFFSDLAQDTKLVAPLKTCLRAELAEIVDLAAKVKQGIPIPSQPLPDHKSLIKLIIESKMHVLTPLRKGYFGVDSLNQTLYREHQRLGHHEIPIMVKVNDPTLELFNGDTGTLNQRENVAYFPSGKNYPEYLLPHYEYAYVLSVHKSQGSEYDRVMILLPEGSEVFGREMLYTAITRAKKEVVIFSNNDIMQAVVANRAHRISGVIRACNYSPSNPL